MVGTKRGKLVDKGYLYKLLNNRTYLGLAVHKGTACKCRMKNPQKCRTKIPHFRELGSAGIRHGRLHFSAADRVVLAAAAV